MGKRGTSVLIRMTESELTQIRERMEEFGTTNMSAFIRKMAIDGYIVKLELPELKEMMKKGAGRGLPQPPQKYNLGALSRCGFLKEENV